MLISKIKKAREEAQTKYQEQSKETHNNLQVTDIINFYKYHIVHIISIYRSLNYLRFVNLCAGYNMP